MESVKKPEASEKLSMEHLAKELGVSHKEVLLICKEARRQQSNLSEKSFLVVLSAISEQGFQLMPIISDKEFRSAQDTNASTKDPEEWLAVDSPPELPRELSSDESSEFEVDLDNEEEELYTEFLTSKLIEAQPSPNGFPLEQEVVEATKRIRKQSYDEYLQQGGVFDHLELQEKSSPYRKLFQEAGLNLDLDNLTGPFLSAKVGMSSYLLLTENRIIKIRKSTTTPRVKRDFSYEEVERVCISLRGISIWRKDLYGKKGQCEIKTASINELITKTMILFLKKFWKEKVVFYTV